MKTRLFLTVLACAFLCGCHDDYRPELEYGSFPSKYFVQLYVDVNDIQITDYTAIDGFNNDYPDDRFIQMFFLGNHIDTHSGDEFLELAESNGDVSYNKRLTPFSNRSVKTSPGSISIVCDMDFDANHPAGQPLGDIVELWATSPLKFIQNGYKTDGLPSSFRTFIWRAMNQDYGYSPVIELLNEVDGETTRMLYPLCFLHFKSLPVAPGDYTFTVSVKIGDETIRKSVAMTF